MDETSDNVNESATESKFPPDAKLIEEIIKRVSAQYGLPPGYTWEDVRQETLIRYARWLDTGRTVESPKGLLTTLAEGILTDGHRYARAASRDFRKEVWLDDPRQGEAQRRASREEDVRGKLLMDELHATLSGSDRDLFEQYFYQERTFTEIAKERGVSKQAVSAQWTRMLNKLKRRVESEFVGTRHRLEEDQEEIERLRDATRSNIEDLKAS